jgi:hypothetical protein
MKLSPIIENYTLERRMINENQIAFNLIPNNLFESKAIGCPVRLIYLVKNQDDFLYVGEAKSCLKTRLSRGFYSYRHYKRTNKKRGGYGGYKWIDLFDKDNQEVSFVNKLDIVAILFDTSFNETRHKIEAIEGELVYIIKKKTGKWPLYQNEIHFNNRYKDAENIAEKIFKSL